MRKLVIVSGYYGFGNLGDEAILEQLLFELKQLMPAEQIVVLSAQPERTAIYFNVASINRWSMIDLIRLLSRAQLFISGGGTLFQETRSPGSIIFYGGQLGFARLLGCPSLVYAQGIGPLVSSLGRIITRLSFSAAASVSVRDGPSSELLTSWGITHELTADPVWSLKPTALPGDVDKLLGEAGQEIVGLSLRKHQRWGQEHTDRLTSCLIEALPASAHLLLIAFQPAEDLALLEAAARNWQNAGRSCTLLPAESLARPSQMLTLASRLKLMVAMRLHAQIAALSSGVPVVGIKYDPKVSNLMATFEQPGISPEALPAGDAWLQALRLAWTCRDKLGQIARQYAAQHRLRACQNINLLAKILGMQSDRGLNP